MRTRRNYTELVRHFLAGRMTNFEYELACDKLTRNMDEAWNIGLITVTRTLNMT